MIVQNNKISNKILLFFIMKKCLIVTVKPEKIRIIVLIKGTFKNSNIMVLVGGQVIPISKVGDKK